MKKIFMTFAAACAVFASCSKDNGIVDNEPAQETNVSDIKFNINVAEIGAGTRAAKKGWEAGDKINIWIDDLDVISLMGDTKGRAEITLTYDGTSWTGSIDEFYATHTDGAGNLDGLPHTIKNNGVLNCLYEGSNNIADYVCIVNGYDYCFSRTDGSGIPVSPLMCCADNVAYTYDGTTISADINNWTVLTMIQVVIPGLDNAKAAGYSLSCDNLQNVSCINKCYQDIFGYGEFMADTDDCTTCGVSNSEGVAFCFYDVADPDECFTFTLSDGTDSWIYEAGYKDIETSSDKVKFIKLPSLSEAGKWIKQ